MIETCLVGSTVVAAAAVAGLFAVASVGFDSSVCGTVAVSGVFPVTRLQIG